MERHTLHDTATNAAPQASTSHSYSAWRTSQQTQPRILQYNPPQQAAQQTQSQTQSAQPPQQPPVFSNSSTAASAATPTLSADLKSNLIFQNAQQFIQNPGTQTQFSAIPDESASGPTGTGSTLPQTGTEVAAKGDASQASGGRALATSKRAAQNRAAQRAFRQRKERYIKSLEQKATDYDLSAGIIADLRKENIYLRDYVLRLQNEVDSLNSELGRAPMFGSRNSQATQSQSPSLNVSLSQTYPIQIDPQTAAAAVAGNVSTQADTQPTLTRLAPAEPTHNTLPLSGSNDPAMTEPKADEATIAPKKTTNRSRKRKNEIQSEAS